VVSLLPTISASVSTATPESKITHVVIISVDGMGAYVLAAAEAPNINYLVARGAFSSNAQTVKISETLPSHASMLSGMVPEKHGILWGVPYIGWPGMNGPTLFSVAHDAGLSTAMVFGKQKMNYLVLPHSVDTCFCQDAHDPEIKEQAVKIIQAGLPNVLFIHFPDTDRVGHADGWGSPNQLYAITYVDGLIGEIVAALENGGYLSNTLLVLTADHGGHGLRHGDDSPIDRTIPWLAVGPKVRSGVTLGSSINTYDTAATVLYALGLPIPENWDGKPVLEIFQ
jgi:predicted AlkP superfamily pyrophosphatase or phosphodiesterase